jgi:hypothetical protein
MSARFRTGTSPQAGDSVATARHERIRSDLARLGVASEVRDELTSRLAALAPRLTPEAYDAVLAGVALAHGLHREGDRLQQRSLNDLQEIQRLLAGFADELRKVDEALRILSTYVSRMRSRAAPRGARTVH